MRPRLAIYYESRLGRNDGNPLYVWNELKRRQGLGELEVEHLAPTGDLRPFGKFDYHIWVDWGEDALKGILPYEPIPCPKPMAYWASDTHLGYAYRLQTARSADLVFCAQKRAAEEFKRDGIPGAVWLPHAAEPMAYPKQSYASKKFDVCFVGHINSGNRIDALDVLFGEFPNFFYGQRRFEDAAQIYGQSKIVFNISMLDDINMRTFEAMASGSMLLTNWIPTIEDLFEDGKHLALYRSPEEMVEKARYYIEHDEEREKIAAAGYAEVMAKHTFRHRLDVMLDAMKSKEAQYAGV